MKSSFSLVLLYEKLLNTRLQSHRETSFNAHILSITHKTLIWFPCLIEIIDTRVYSKAKLYKKLQRVFKTTILLGQKRLPWNKEKFSKKGTELVGLQIVICELSEADAHHDHWQTQKSELSEFECFAEKFSSKIVLNRDFGCVSPAKNNALVDLITKVRTKQKFKTFVLKKNEKTSNIVIILLKKRNSSMFMLTKKCGAATKITIK